MSDLSRDDVKRLMTEVEVPPPPPELLESIRAEIPDDVGLGLDLGAANDLAPVVPFWRRRGLAVAATVAVALGGGYLALRVQQQMEPLQTRTAEEAVVAEVPSLERGSEQRSRIMADSVGDGADPRSPSLTETTETGPSSAAADESAFGEGLAAGRLGAEVSAPVPPEVAESRSLDEVEVAEPLRGLREAAREDPVEQPPEPPGLLEHMYENRASEAEWAQIEAPSPLPTDLGKAEKSDDRAAPEAGAAPRAEAPVASSWWVESDRKKAAPGDLEAPAEPEPAVEELRPDGLSTAKPTPPMKAERPVNEERFNARIEYRNEKYDDLLAESQALERELRAIEEEARTKRKLREGPVPPGQVASPPPPPPSARPVAPASTRHRALASTGGTAEPNDAPYGDVFFRSYGTNPFIDTEDDRLSTFALDVDTGSYGVVRRYLTDGHLPPPAAVRVEEMVNYFDYGDPAPEEGEFALHAEGAPSPFGEGSRYRLLRFAIRGREIDDASRRPADLTFVVDVSGSMARENRLGLVKQALELLLGELRPDDRVALVVYGSHAELRLNPTSDKEAVRRAIRSLVPNGSTNAEEGLRLAYKLAALNRRPGAIHRVILCSDGVANVGRTGPESILEQIQAHALLGIELTTVGFGMGNYNDVLMEQLADKGNGRYAYVDTLAEARRIFVEGLTGTLQTLAAEARSQVEFNPEVVSRYRLVGYENRDVPDARFRDDTVDAGEIGVGHAVTALYEIKLLRKLEREDQVATLRLRYGSLAQGEMVEVERPVTGADFAKRWEKSSPALRLTTLVAELGELLKGSYWARSSSPDRLLSLLRLHARDFRKDDGKTDDKVSELVRLTETAVRLRRAED